MNPPNRLRPRVIAVILGRGMSSRARALRFRNGPAWCAIATMLAGITLGAAAPAFPRPSQTPTATHAPSAAQSVEAFAIARKWLTSFDAPRMDAAESRVALENASAVCVILRRYGRVMGFGIDDVGDELMIRRALGRAMNETLSDPALQNVAAGIRREAGANDTDAEARLDALRRDLGRTLTLELEVAGPRQPLVGATLKAMAAKIEPGVDGLSLRRDQKWSHVFPAQLRVTNLAGDPLKSLTSLAVNAGFAMKDLDEAATLQDTSVYRFDAVNLAQERPEAAPVQLFRGERLIPIEEVTRQRIALLAEGLVKHMLRCRFPDPPAGDAQTRLPLGFMGDYSPTADQFTPTIAPPLEQALCALALTRYAQSSSATTEMAKDAAVAARQALRDLSELAERESPPTDDLAACAAVIMVAAEMPSCMGDGNIAILVRAAMQRLNDSFDAQRGFNLLVQGEAEQAKPITPIAQAMIASAWARLLVAKVDGLLAPPSATIRAALDAAWMSSPENTRVALLPWIGWAERDFAKATGSPLAHQDDLRKLAVALDRVRIAPEAGTPADLHGGLALTGGTGADGIEMRRPTAQTVRPVAWLASIAADDSLTPADKQADRWKAHLEAMRFVVQLTVSEVRAATLRGGNRARGGLSSAPWDQRQPVAAQAMGLLAAVETLDHWPKTP